MRFDQNWLRITPGNKQSPSNGNLEERAQGNTEEKHKRDIFLCKNVFNFKKKKKNPKLHLECLGK